MRNPPGGLPPISLSPAGPQNRHGLDLDQEFRRCQRADLDEGGDREVTREELSACPPDLLAPLDIGHENIHLDHIVHAAPGLFHDMLDFSERCLSLLIHAVATRDVASRVATA